MDNSDPDSPEEVVVPQVPTLSPDDEARLRPSYDRMFDQVKIARDKKTNLEYRSAKSLDSKALHSFNKQNLQVSVEHPFTFPHLIDLYLVS